jgi:carbamoyl-phosphate synthase small subunit
MDQEEESDSIKFSGMVCKSFSEVHSRGRADDSLNGYFEKSNIVGISDVDTRQIVRHIRDKGAMNAIISSEELEVESLKKQLSEVPSMDGLELSTHVSVEAPYTLGDESGSKKVAVLDLGIKKSILKNFVSRNCFVKVFPAKTPVSELIAWGADGYFISNGPGDPAATAYAIETTKVLIEEGKPVFGICLGHQIIALAAGVKTYKMHNGHRGLNHPVKNIITGTSEITSQNHGFAISTEDVEQNPNVEVTHINLNDNTVEGIRLKGKDVFSVQYHPESCPGPHDSHYLFDDFISLLKK